MCRWSGRIDQPFAKVRPTDWQPPIEWVVGEMTIKDANLLLISWIKERPDETANQKAALEQYGKLFHPDNLPNLTEEEVGISNVRITGIGDTFSDILKSTSKWIAFGNVSRSCSMRICRLTNVSILSFP